MELSTINKALAAALGGALAALLARYGFTDPAVVNALNVLVTALVGAVVPAVVTYLAPKNKE